MRKLYCIPDCDPCKRMKEWIQQQETIDVEISELTKIEEEWHEKTDDGFVKFDKSIHSFPALFVGKQGDNRVFVLGEEGIQSLLEKNYIYESKICPYLNGPCIEKKCGKFVIMTKGPIQEAGCSDYWTPILLTDILTKEK
jgi:glutaredoxin